MGGVEQCEEWRCMVLRSLLEGRAGLEETEDEEEESGSSVCERDGGVWEGCGGRGEGVWWEG